MADKEIIIDGAIYNGCNGCSLYDGNVCTGAKTYEDNAKRDRHICDEHLASQFWVVFKQLKRKEQECEELKKELQAQRDFTAHEQKLIYCVAYDETCKTGNDCKQQKCIFKDNIKLKQTLTAIKGIAEENIRIADSEGLNGVYRRGLAKQILQKISEVENE